MAFLYYFILVLHIVACLFLIGVVLLQQGKGQDLASAFGGGGSQTAFGPRGSATVLSRATTILAGLFMVTSLTLSVLRRGPSVLETLPAPAASPSPVASGSPTAGAPASATPETSTSTPVAASPAAAAPASPTAK
jgi:preprotein translocase subunit SecG